MSTPVSARISAVLPWSMCPAVPSVSGGRSSRPSAARAAAATASSSSLAQRARIAAPAPLVDPATTGGSPRRSAPARASGRARRAARPPGPRARAGQGAAADLGGCARMTPAAGSDRRRASRAAASPARLGGAEHGQHGDLRAGRSRVAIQRQRRLQRGQRELVDAQGAGERMRAGGRDASPVPDQQAGLRVRRAACRPSSTRAPRRPPPSAASRAPRPARDRAPTSTPEPTSSITGTPSSHSSSIGHVGSTKPRARKFDGCTRRIAADLGSRPRDGALIVSQAGAVGRARPRSAGRPTGR